MSQCDAGGPDTAAARVISGSKTLRPPGGTHTFFDCRNVFDPLTTQHGCCIEVSPRSGWEHVIDEIVGLPDVCLCFQTGDFTTTRTLALRNANVKINGAGQASRITGVELDTVFLFDGCSSIAVSDLSLCSTARIACRNAETPSRRHHYDAQLRQRPSGRI